MNCSKCKAPGMCICPIDGSITGGNPQPSSRQMQQAIADLYRPTTIRLSATSDEEAERYRSQTFTIEVINDQTGARQVVVGARFVEVSPRVFEVKLTDHKS